MKVNRQEGKGSSFLGIFVKYSSFFLINVYF